MRRGWAPATKSQVRPGRPGRPSRPGCPREPPACTSIVSGAWAEVVTPGVDRGGGGRGQEPAPGPRGAGRPPCDRAEAQVPSLQRPATLRGLRLHPRLPFSEHLQRQRRQAPPLGCLARRPVSRDLPGRRPVAQVRPVRFLGLLVSSPRLVLRRGVLPAGSGHPGPRAQGEGPPCALGGNESAQTEGSGLLAEAGRQLGSGQGATPLRRGWKVAPGSLFR